MSGLSPEQIAFFQEQGYLLLPHFIDPAAFDPLIWEFEEIIAARARQAYHEGRLKELFEQAPFDRRLALLYSAMEEPGDLWRAVHGKKRRRTVIQAASGYSGARSRHRRKANEQLASTQRELEAARVEVVLVRMASTHREANACSCSSGVCLLDDYVRRHYHLVTAWDNYQIYRRCGPPPCAREGPPSQCHVAPAGCR